MRDLHHEVAADVLRIFAPWNASGVTYDLNMKRDLNALSFVFAFAKLPTIIYLSTGYIARTERVWIAKKINSCKYIYVPTPRKKCLFNTFAVEKIFLVDLTNIRILNEII